MKIIDVVQGSNEWVMARLGLPTASEFSRVITPKKREKSSGQDGYLAQLAAEWFLNAPLADYVSEYMERGREMEAEAVAAYQWESDKIARVVGLCVRDDGTAGASPDRLIGDDGVLEIKCPSAEKHMGYLFKPDTLRDDYFAQVQGEMYITGAKWADLWSFNPVIPSVLVRVERDEDFITKLDGFLNDFILRLDGAKARLAAQRPEPVERRQIVRDSDPFATTPATPIVLHGEPFQ